MRSESEPWVVSWLGSGTRLPAGRGARRRFSEVRRHVARATVRSPGVLLALVLLAAPLPASAAGRVALVVGNSTYEHTVRLQNPANDAADLSAALRRLGFDVTVARDAGRTALTEALRAFTRRSAGADVALVFYAGHGMEMDGVNYLLPVDARVERDTDLRYETVTLDDVLASTAGAGLRVVILDACRDNPLARSMTRTVRSRSVSNGSFGELDEALLGDETLVAYSAAAGTTADDGAGRNSPYAAALLAHLEERLEVGMLFRRVRERVLNATDGRQRPHEYHSLLGEHYLGVAPVGGGLAAAGGAGVSAASVAARGSSPVLAQQETVFWESVRESANPAELEAYLARWPNGVYAPLARTRVATLRSAAVVDPPRIADTRQQDLDVFRDCSDCPEMVVIPAGEFQMGSNRGDDEAYDNELPRHRVSVGRFALGRYEVTRAEYEAFVSATGRADSRRCLTDDGRGNWEWRWRNGASWRDPRFPQGDDLRLPRFRGQVNAWVPIMTGPRMDGFACESSTRKALWTCGNLAASVQAPAAAIAREISNGLWAPAAPICDAARRPAGVHRPGRSTAPPASGRSADAASRRLSASRRRRRAVRPCAIMPSPCFRQQRR